MRCKSCGYRLWNAVPGGCSECGAPWRFEDFRFVPGLVQFCCTTCGRAYMGTDADGLPLPRSFVCSGCGTELDLSRMRALPAPDITDDSAMVVEHAWSERKRFGRWRAFWTTVGQSLGNPRRLVTSLPQRPSLLGALWFAVLAVFIPTSIAVAPVFIVPFGMMPLRGSVMQTQQWLSVVGGFLLILVLSALTILLAAAISALFTHLLLRWTGGVKRSLRWTLCTSLYCLGPFVCSALPCCGVYLVLVTMTWSYISFIIATMELHKTGALRATFVVLAPPIGSNLIGGALAYWFIVGP
ncbi:MAG: YIP1 family protein [Planctomycetes bacterium]|nr:YIP1 family protein [Planctomycetota bacterium]